MNEPELLMRKLRSMEKNMAKLQEQIDSLSNENLQYSG
jgi:DNA-binding protein YbaB